MFDGRNEKSLDVGALVNFRPRWGERNPRCPVLPPLPPSSYNKEKPEMCVEMFG